MRKSFTTLCLIIFTLFLVSSCSKQGPSVVEGEGGDGSVTGGGALTNTCPTDKCTTASVDDIIKQLANKYNLDNIITLDYLADGLVLKAPPGCTNNCVKFNKAKCVVDNTVVETDDCKKLETSCQVRCDETYNLSGHPKANYTLEIPHDYHAIELTLEACVDYGRDMLYMDNTTMYYKHIAGTEMITADVDGDGTETVNPGSPVGLSRSCIERLRFKNSITVKGVTSESVTWETASGVQTIPIKPLNFEEKTYEWARPDSFPFGLRFLNDKVDFSDGVRWIITAFDEPEPDNWDLYHIVHMYDNQTHQLRPTLGIETWAPYDPVVKYKFFGFIKPKLSS